MEIPGSFGHSILGDKTLDFFKDTDKFIEKNIRRFDSRIFLSRLFLKKTICIADHAIIKEVLKDENHLFDMGYEDTLYPFFDDCILFATDGKVEATRKALAECFTPDAFQQQRNFIQSTVDRFLLEIDVSCPLKAGQIFKSMAYHIAISIFLDIAPDENPDLTREIIELLRTHWKGISSTPVSFHLPHMGAATTYSKAIQAKEKLQLLFGQRLLEAQNGIIPILREAESLSDSEKVNNLLVCCSGFIVKAISGLLTGFLLSSNFWYKDHVQNEEISPENWEYILLEVRRMYSPPLGPRRVTRKDCVVGGYQLPKEVTVMCLTGMANKDPKVFPDPETFSPQRWKNHTLADPHSLLTFGLGPRSCLAKVYINLIFQIVCKGMFSQYRWEIVDEEKGLVQFTKCSISVPTPSETSKKIIKPMLPSFSSDYDDD